MRGILPLDFCRGNQDAFARRHARHTMYPPKFLASHLLSQWQERSLEIVCRRCETRMTAIGVKGLMRWQGNRQLRENPA
jgi:hypothetical protein